MKKQIVTTYGSAIIEVRQIVGAPIFVCRQKIVFPAGHKTPGGETLPEKTEIKSGAILLPRWSRNGGGRIYGIYAHGIYEAIRGVAHIFFGYGVRGSAKGELQTLETMSSQLVDIISLLAEGKEIGSAKLNAIQAELSALAEQMAAVVNPEKYAARNKIAASETLEVRHSSGKMVTNLPANVARLAAAEQRLRKRQEEVRRIASRLVSQEQALALELGRVWNALNWLRKMLEDGKRRLENHWTAEEQAIFRRRAGWALNHFLSEVDVEPFLHTARLIRRDLGKALSSAGKNHDEVRVAVNRILASLRFKDAERAFERKVLTPFAIRQELGILTPSDMRHTRRRIADFRRRLAQLDDRDFVSPHKDEILPLLDRAIAEIDRLGLGSALIVKETLKLVSHLL